MKMQLGSVAEHIQEFSPQIYKSKPATANVSEYQSLENSNINQLQNYLNGNHNLDQRFNRENTTSFST
jgi:hypothetical protein